MPLDLLSAAAIFRTYIADVLQELSRIAAENPLLAGLREKANDCAIQGCANRKLRNGHVEMA